MNVVHFFVADAKTGAGLRRGTCHAGDLAAQAREGEIVVATDGQKPDDKFKLDLTKSPPVVVPLQAATGGGQPASTG